MSAGRACHLRLGSELLWLVSSIAAFGLASALRSESDKPRLFSLFLNLIKKHFASIPNTISSANCIFAVESVGYFSLFRTLLIDAILQVVEVSHSTKCGG